MRTQTKYFTSIAGHHSLVLTLPKLLLQSAPPAPYMLRLTRFVIFMYESASVLSNDQVSYPLLYHPCAFSWEPHVRLGVPLRLSHDIHHFICILVSVTLGSLGCEPQA